MDGKTNFINGRWLPAISSEVFESRNPADTRDLIGVFSRSDARDIDEAVRAAAAAYDAWRLTPAPARAAVLTRMGRLLEERKEQIAAEMVREMGKPIVEARGDVQEAIDMAHYIAAYGRLPNGVLTASERPEVFCAAQRTPIGVVGLITPWNFPVAIPSWKMFPALVSGNTVVLKPAEDTPGLAYRFVGLLAEAGAPAGVVNLVTGYGPEAGGPLVEHPDVAAISFTGSTAIGRLIASRAGERMKRVSCELGGKNAIVVLADADIDLAVSGALWSAFGTSGQRCTAASRIIVQRDVKERFTSELVRRAKALRVGAGADAQNEVGPLINAAQLGRVDEYVHIGRAEGASLRTGGLRLSGAGLDYGHFYAPTVFDEVAPQMRIAQEEIFGPVTAIIEADDFSSALDIANGTAYGLSLSLYTRDVHAAMRGVRDLQAGLVYINMPTSGAEIQLPFGGVKNTGNGHREAGWTAMDYCTEWKSITINYSASSDLVRAQIDTLAAGREDAAQEREDEP